MPARYFDPITQLPYRNIQAFKILREAYYQQLEEKGNSANPEVLKWLQWRKKVLKLLELFFFVQECKCFFLGKRSSK